ncbi:hypothetical protein LSUE1_G000138 [Lachnellula suecica]|uniref:AB hydrolase-1 domain-containing protein n=1 Tax=Lachnellula suecica TaxID=602035 RepID=A0A8T9CIL4_9HELO|nr:hypothetical protein LSUE1_G000138 [Lachnellula suecica]
MAVSPEDLVAGTLSQIKYHQIFTLPATDSHGPLKVTYALAGVSLTEDAPTILFCGGMFADRWQAIQDDYIAAKSGVSVIYIDRPGFGGSTPVPLDQRISTVTEIVLALLRHLNIKHVSLVGHCAGTVYALNLLSKHPEILNLARPFITLITPWVHQKYTGAKIFKAAGMLPNMLFNYVDLWQAFISFSITDAISDLVDFIRNRKNSQDEKYTEEYCKEYFGLDYQRSLELFRSGRQYQDAEVSKGVNDEAKLCLKTAKKKCGWGAAENLPELVEGLRKVWEQRVIAGQQKLKVVFLLAKYDEMIRKKGEEYLASCWSQEKCGAGIVVSTYKTEDTDHQSVGDLDNRRMVFECVKMWSGR